ncbi:phosphoglucosamine mutase [Mollicutes bacterium LVI A0078]|nr:phosphoglucosamine mutase [Mollicutes bacterium LVI A0075]WOO91503.1 phosphoglucosamine mutase [Mollicutes bacterium LVI A0078]
MGKYFGTDGIRGEFNNKLTVDLAFEIGKAAGSIYPIGSKVCIGQDPRKSSSTIEFALVSGLLATGVNVVSFGVTSTPCVSYSIIHHSYESGIMISASHNPYYDNGIKFFGKNGSKLSDELEAKMEALIDSKEYRLVDTKDLGTHTFDTTAVSEYENYLVSLGTSMKDVKICLDSANGSSYNLAKAVFKRLGADVTVIGDRPDGININDNIGSTHPEKIAELMKSGEYDFGFAYDGDADRIILIANDGTILDGDYILFLLGKYFKQNDKLKNNVVISTVMANLGFIEGLAKEGIEVVKTSVGDRFVMQGIVEHDAAVGGEQSGHIILPEFLPTGDGILVSVFLANLIVNSEDDILHLANQMEKFPQVLINKKVADKHAAMESPELLAEIEKYEKQLGETGRILVRSSGTEELVRVMVEAKDLETCQTICENLMEFVN